MQTTPYLNPPPEKASAKTLFAYSIGFAPSAVLCNNVYYLFYMYFMTDVAGISAIVAGWISLGAIAWDAVSDPFIAYKSDNCRLKGGRRIPFMTIGVLLMSVALSLLFTVLDVSVTMRSVWFMFFAVVFWTGATMWDIPHNALGASLVTKHAQREKLRVGTTIVDGIGLMFITYVIPNFSEYLEVELGDKGRAWQLTVVVIAAISLAIGLTVCAILKHREPLIDWPKYDKQTKASDTKQVGVMVTIKELFQIRPYKFLVGGVISINTGSVLVQSSIVYFMTYISGFNAQQQSIVLVVSCATHLAVGLSIGFIFQKRLGSRKIFIGGLTIALVGIAVVPNFLPVGELGTMLLFVVTLAIGIRALWLYCYIYAYGIAMLDDIKNKKHREGNIVGFMSFGLKLGSAIATWVIGAVLQASGYVGDQEIQSESALSGIHTVTSILPVIFVGVGLFLMILYPLRDRHLTDIEKAIEARDRGEEYSTESFAHLM
jgi:GPH family glycoside/pentoside/hexuronide:cation symporter